MLESLEKMLGKGVDNSLLRFGLGKGYLDLGDNLKAAEHLQRCVAFDPTYSAAWKLLVGPSAPLCREALDLGFAAVCGARVTDVPAVVRVLQEGGCFQQIRRTGGVRLLNLEA